MATSDATITIGVDDRTATALKNIKNNLNGVKGELENTSKAAVGGGTSIGNLVKGIVAGAVAYNLLRQAARFVTTQIKESIGEALASEAIWTSVASNLANAGIAYEQVAERIKQVTQEEMRLGFTDEETALSISRLSLATQNLDKALEVHRLALDLARFKGVDLETATYALTKAYTGNRMILRQLGIEVDEVSNREKMLQMVHQQTANAAERYARTTKGMMDALRVSVSEVKEQIGFALLPVINYLMEGMGGAANATGILIGAFKVLGSILVGIIFICREVGQALSTIIASAVAIAQGDFSNLKNIWKVGLKDMGMEAVNAQKTINQTWSGGMKNINFTTQTNLRAVGDGIKDNAKKIAESVKKEMADYTKDIARMTANFQESLKDLVFAHKEKRKSLEKDIKEENADFEDANKERKLDLDDTLAEMKDSHEEKVASIMEQIDEETAKGIDADKKRLADLQKSLAQEEVAHDKATAKTMANYEKETAKAKEEHEKRLKALQEGLDLELEIEKKHADDFAALKDAVAEDDITRLKRKFEEERKVRQADHEARLKELYSQGAAEQAAYEAGKKGASQPSPAAGTTTTVTTTKITTPKVVSPTAAPITKTGRLVEYVAQTGGIVPGPIGEPVLATVHAGERITPMGRSPTGGGGIIFNVSIGLYAGTETEKRNVAKELYAALVQVAVSQNKTVKELMGA